MQHGMLFIPLYMFMLYFRTKKYVWKMLCEKGISVLYTSNLIKYYSFDIVCFLVATSIPFVSCVKLYVSMLDARSR